AYGDLSKDLEDERVTAYLSDCAQWQEIGDDLTNSDGRSVVNLDTMAHGLGVGSYRVEHVVAGDGSRLRSRIDTVPARTHVVVFDIDGTLTTSDGELANDIVSEFFEPLLTGDYVPEAWPGAVALTREYEARGYVIVYVTGRPYFLHKITRGWL